MAKSRSRRDVSTPIANSLSTNYPRFVPYNSQNLINYSTGQLFGYSEIKKDLRRVQDQRRWSPSSSTRDLFGRPYYSLTNKVDRRATARLNPFNHFPVMSPVVAFKNPDRILVCVRRSIRKQVLHAFGIAGRSGSRRRQFRKPRFNRYSKISCRR